MDKLQTKKAFCVISLMCSCWGFFLFFFCFAAHLFVTFEICLSSLLWSQFILWLHTSHVPLIRRPVRSSCATAPVDWMEVWLPQVNCLLDSLRKLSHVVKKKRRSRKQVFPSINTFWVEQEHGDAEQKLPTHTSYKWNLMYPQHNVQLLFKGDSFICIIFEVAKRG